MRGVAGTLAVIFTILVVVVGIVNVNMWLNFKNGCGDYLKLAGNAPTVQRANEFLGAAVNYIEKHGLTHGNSAYVFHTPENDVGVWHNQIKGAYETTVSVLQREKESPGSVTQLEKDNALMKVREVVLDGISITAPDNITVFPNQWLVAIGWIISILGGAIFWFCFYLLS